MCVGEVLDASRKQLFDSGLSIMQTTVTISDADRNVDYILLVDCDFLAGSAPHWGWRNGGEPGEGPAVEVNHVRCLELAVWCGKSAVAAFPAADARESLEGRIGAWCLDKYPQEIEQAVLEAILVRQETDRD
jgi:hypothetical protein